MINKLVLLASLLLTFLYQKRFHQSSVDTLYSDTVLMNKKILFSKRLQTYIDNLLITKY